MAQVLDIRALRIAGALALESKVYVGLLRLGHHAGRRSLSLVNSKGELQLGPLLDTEFAVADFDGLVLGGKEPEAGLPQDWQVLSAKRLEGYPAIRPEFSFEVFGKVVGSFRRYAGSRVRLHSSASVAEQ